MNHSRFLPPPVRLSQAFEGETGSDGISRRTFIKRTGGATVATMVAWHLSAIDAQANPGSGEVSDPYEATLKKARMHQDDPEQPEQPVTPSSHMQVGRSAPFAIGNNEYQLAVYIDLACLDSISEWWNVAYYGTAYKAAVFQKVSGTDPAAGPFTGHVYVTPGDVPATVPITEPGYRKTDLTCKESNGEINSRSNPAGLISNDAANPMPEVTLDGEDYKIHVTGNQHFDFDIAPMGDDLEADALLIQEEVGARLIKGGETEDVANVTASIDLIFESQKKSQH